MYSAGKIREDKEFASKHILPMQKNQRIDSLDLLEKTWHFPVLPVFSFENATCDNLRLSSFNLGGAKSPESLLRENLANLRLILVHIFDREVNSPPTNDYNEKEGLLSQPI